MMQLAGQPLGIAQGSVLLFSDFQHDGPMWAGTGQRELRQAVGFAQAFAAAPAVMLGVSLWDLDHRSNPRGDLSADRVTAAGFEIVFRTWGDSRIARLRVDWTAFGPLYDPELWAL